jgi:hypothetical protein
MLALYNMDKLGFVCSKTKDYQSVLKSFEDMSNSKKMW